MLSIAVISDLLNIFVLEITRG